MEGAGRIGTAEPTLEAGVVGLSSWPLAAEFFTAMVVITAALVGRGASGNQKAVTLARATATPGAEAAAELTALPTAMEVMPAPTSAQVGPTAIIVAAVTTPTQQPQPTATAVPSTAAPIVSMPPPPTSTSTPIAQLVNGTILLTHCDEGYPCLVNVQWYSGDCQSGIHVQPEALAVGRICLSFNFENITTNEDHVVVFKASSGSLGPLQHGEQGCVAPLLVLIHPFSTSQLPRTPIRSA